MPIKTFTAGEVLTASDVNTYLMNQAVITCTSATRPGSPSEGMTIYETDTDQYKTYSGSAWETGLKSGGWVAYTPTITGTSAWVLGNATLDCAYQQVGRLVAYRGRITLGTTSSASGQLQVTLPKAKVGATSDPLASGVEFFDASTSAVRIGNVTATGSILALRLSTVTGTEITQTALAATVPWTWTTSDYISWVVVYETSVS